VRQSPQHTLFRLRALRLADLFQPGDNSGGDAGGHVGAAEGQFIGAIDDNPGFDQQRGHWRGAQHHQIIKLIDPEVCIEQRAVFMRNGFGMVQAGGETLGACQIVCGSGDIFRANGENRGI